MTKKILRWVMIPIGALGGWAYYQYVGCPSGSCALASNGPFMVIYGAILGFFIGGIFSPVHQKV